MRFLVDECTGPAVALWLRQQNHDVIMTPGSMGLYIDHKQSNSPDEPVTIGGFAPYQKIYAYDPIPKVLNADQRKYIKGVQANMWSEYLETPAKVEYQLFQYLMNHYYLA